jgi:hypothetical protein
MLAYEEKEMKKFALRCALLMSCWWAIASLIPIASLGPKDLLSLSGAGSASTSMVSLTAPPTGLIPAKGNGSDETKVIQNIIYYAIKNNKSVLIPSGYTFIVDGLTIAQSSHFTIYGYGTLKLKSGATGPILKLSNCSSFNIPTLHTNGNVAGNYGTIGKFSQNLHSLSINNCQDFHIGSQYDVNPSGDSLYLNVVNNATIGTLDAKADVPSGRNALCIISAQNVTIDRVISANVGDKGQPGGINFEPNWSGDHIENVLIKSATIRTSAVNGLQVSNENGAVVKGIEINAEVTKVNNSSSSVFKLNHVENFKGNIKINQEGTNRCVGASITNSNYVNANLEIYNSSEGMGVGKDSSNIHLTGKIIRTQGYGLALWEGVKDSTFNMEIKQTGLDGRSGRVKASGVVDQVVFMGDYSFDGTGVCCFSLDGMISNCRAENLNASGWPMKSLVIGSSAASLPINNAIAIYMNGQPLALEDQPIIKNGRVLVPMRGFFQALGVAVEWNEATRTAVGTRADIVVRIPIGSSEPTVNGVIHTIDVPAIIINSRTYIPLRFVGEAFGDTVVWDGSTQSINIEHDEAQE